MPVSTVVRCVTSCPLICYSYGYKLHVKLDRLVLQAYGFNPNDDLLEKLLTLNLELAEKEKRGDAIVGAWAPIGA